MPTRTSQAIAVRFGRVLANIQPIEAEVATARSRMGAIASRLKDSLDVASVRAIGSHAKRTALRRISDLDVLVVLRRVEVTWGGSRVASSTVLQNVREELRGRYPNSSIRRDAQAVTVTFEAGRHSIDVVPGVFAAPAPSGQPVFEIPDRSGGWLVTSPDLQQARLTSADNSATGKLRRTLQLMKYWTYTRNPRVPLNSTRSGNAPGSVGLRCRPCSILAAGCPMPGLAPES